MKYRLEYHKDFIKFLAKHSDIKDKALSAFEQLAQNPYENSLDIAKLKGEINKYRLRLGKYRFLYEIFEAQILIYAYKADSRGDVYK